MFRSVSKSIYNLWNIHHILIFWNFTYTERFFALSLGQKESFNIWVFFWSTFYNPFLLEFCIKKVESLSYVHLQRPSFPL